MVGKKKINHICYLWIIEIFSFVGTDAHHTMAVSLMSVPVYQAARTQIIIHVVYFKEVESNFSRFSC